MSDLISRKLVLDKLKDFSDMYTLEEETRIVLETIVRIVTEQPTAYDVEKVVAELEELANHYHKCCLVDYNEGAEVGVRETMAIVRRGGVE